MTGQLSPRRAVGASVRGASHVRAGLPNQDAIGWEQSEGGALVVCVADGHGSKKCFRSHVGARLAVAAGIDVGRRFLDAEGGVGEASALPAALVAEWRQRVAEDLARSPITDGELKGLDQPDRQLVGSTPVLAYGATLLTVLFTPDRVVVLQVGDGDVLFVAPSGETTRPVPKDARLLGNETTSLSAPGAENDFRLAVERLGPDGPALVIVATDGFGNAYADDASFLKVGSDVLARVRSDGMDGVDGDLETWLASASSYDGDDVSAVIVSLGQNEESGRSRVDRAGATGSELRGLV